MKVYLILFAALALLDLSQGKTRMSHPELDFDEAEEFVLDRHIGNGNEPSTKEFLANLLNVFLMAQEIKPKYQPHRVDEQQERAGLNADNYKVFKPSSANKPKFSIWG